MRFLPGATTAVDPANNVWVIRRHWFPRWAVPNVRKRFSWWSGKFNPFDSAEGVAENVLVGIVVFLIFVFIVVFLIPVLLVTFDFVILLILFLLGIVGRIVFRRPWVIEATSPDGQTIERNVIGWYASKKEITVLKSKIFKGDFGSSDPGLEPLWPRDRK